MRRQRPLLTLLLLAAPAIAGCSGRERLNPLDPGNILTGGAPQQFVALAGDGGVDLSWLPAPSGLVLGFQLSRRTGGVGPFQVLGDLDPTETRYHDVGLLNGTDHSYRLAFRLTDHGVSAAAEQTATPGTARPWAVDYTARALLRLTPDGRHVAERVSGNFQTPSALDVDPTTGSVWVCDPYGGRFWRVTPQGPTEEVGAVVQPVAVSIDAVRGRVWVCDQGSPGSVLCFDSADILTPPVRFLGLGTPLAVAIDPFDGSAWVCERTADRVAHISLSGARIGSAAALQPSRVAVDSVTHRVWVTSFNGRSVTVFESDGTRVDAVTGLGGPLGIAIDPGARRIWIADAGADRVLVLDPNGVEVLRVTGLFEPVEIGLDTSRGEAWVACSAGGQVIRIAADGRILNRLGGLLRPADIAVERRR